MKTNLFNTFEVFEQLSALKNIFLSQKKELWLKALGHVMVSHEVENENQVLNYTFSIIIPYDIHECVEYLLMNFNFKNLTFENQLISIRDNFTLNIQSCKHYFSQEDLNLNTVLLTPSIYRFNDLNQLIKNYCTLHQTIRITNPYYQFNTNDFYEIQIDPLFISGLDKVFNNWKMNETNEDLKKLKSCLESRMYQEDFFKKTIYFAQIIKENKKDMEHQINSLIEKNFFHIFLIHQLEENNNYYIYEMNIIIPFLKENNIFKCLSFKMKKMLHKQSQRVDVLQFTSKNNIYHKAQIDLRVFHFNFEQQFEIYPDTVFDVHTMKTTIEKIFKDAIQNRYWNIHTFNVQNFFQSFTPQNIQAIQIEKEIIDHFKKNIFLSIEQIFDESSNNIKDILSEDLSIMKNLFLNEKLKHELNLIEYMDEKKITKL